MMMRPNSSGSLSFFSIPRSRDEEVVESFGGPFVGAGAAASSRNRKTHGRIKMSSVRAANEEEKLSMKCCR